MTHPSRLRRLHLVSRLRKCDEVRLLFRMANRWEQLPARPIMGTTTLGGLGGREESEEGNTEVSEAVALSESPFQFNYNDQPPILETRFDEWLQRVLALGLDRWRRSL